MTEGPITATECKERTRKWGEDLSKIFSDLRREAVLDDKHNLKLALESRDSVAIYKYCYMRALRPHFNDLQIELALYSVCTQKVTPDMAADVLNKTARWSARIMRWWGIER